IFYPRHHLEVQIAPVAIALAHDLRRIDNLILSRHTPPDDARRQEHALHFASLLQCIQATRQLIRCEGDTLRLAAPGSKGAIVAVTFASSGVQPPPFQQRLTYKNWYEKFAYCLKNRGHSH